VGRRSLERGGEVARAGGLALGRALAAPLEPVLGRELAFGREGAACGRGAVWGRDDPAEGRLELGAGTARTRDGATGELGDWRPVDPADGGVRGDALGAGVRCGGRVVEGREDEDDGRELAAGGSSGCAGAALDREAGARAGSREGAARVGLASGEGSGCLGWGCGGAGCCGSAEGGVRTGNREVGRRWSVGRARAVSGASCGAVRGLSCGWTRAAGAGAARAEARARADDAAADTAVGDSLYSTGRLAVAALVRTTGATASPSARRATA
jgi:hypothetical protein